MLYFLGFRIDNLIYAPTLIQAVETILHTSALFNQGDLPCLTITMSPFVHFTYDDIA